MANPNPTPPPEHSRFKKGQSGNPNGRPKGVPDARTRYKRILELEQELTNPVTGELEAFTVAEQMDLAIIKKARKGDIRAYEAVLDRLEGKPRQSTDITTDGQPITPVTVVDLGNLNANKPEAESNSESDQ